MTTLYTPQEFLALPQQTAVLDVRSPAEFKKGHIPRAVNLPLFDDEQRAEIGTLYKQKGRDKAVLRGLEIVGPKMADFVRQAQRITKAIRTPLPSNHNADNQPPPVIGVHCWRGGMRSGSFAWLLQQAGFEAVVLEGGYKAYRNHIHQALERSVHLIVISGLTGAGKTKYLHRLRDQGQQVIDLEGLANHRGSAFGAIGLGDQPSTEQFENDLYHAASELDLDRPIWVEDEGNRIGGVVVPESFHVQLRNAPAVFINVSMQRRVDHLIEVYGELPREQLADSVERIKKRLGGQHVTEAIDALERGDLKTTTEIVLKYYDKTYSKAAESMPRALTHQVPIDDLDDDEVTQRLIAAGQKIEMECAR